MRRPVLPPRAAFCFVCTLVTAALAVAVVAGSMTPTA